MGTTSIEWTQKTWNPVTGCTKVSPGCDHCYAEGIARRFAGSKAFPNGFDVTLHPERLDAPLRWRKPARVFVNSMSDLFHDDVPDEFIREVFDRMGAASQHTFQVLTKRHGRMRSLLRRWERCATEGCRCPDSAPGCSMPADVKYGTWPLPNVWLGTSVEDQKRADLRIPALLDTPAAVRFLSCEPLVGPVDLCQDGWLFPDEFDRPGVAWVIVGGESGPGARPMQLDWARQLVDQCRDADVACFVKQLGSAHGPHKGGDITTWPAELQVREYPAGVAA
jgi:protein gp37